MKKRFNYYFLLVLAVFIKDYFVILDLNFERERLT